MAKNILATQKQGILLDLLKFSMYPEGWFCNLKGRGE